MPYFERLHINEPSQGKDPVNGRFIKGNRLGRGRPYRSVGLIRTYGDAIAHACPPQVLFKIVEKAVKDALTNGPDAHGAPMFLLRCLGADQIKVYLNGLHGSPPDSPMLTYNLDALSDEELQALDILSTKMTIERRV